MWGTTKKGKKSKKTKMRNVFKKKLEKYSAI